jgi:hypothetical protein
MYNDSANIEPRDSTIALYDRLATFFDPNISLVDSENASKKSVSRELMSTSVRSIMTGI